ncbi:hypothetical protein [Ancylobacter defluvii]|uniref:hypothetical protein n=1 Tax=Ancylobacter defluvii TaxID=1282440 RepID=UPI001BCF11C5|nr:hypothetical protein [Ancylobacter defluvii]MBS7588395.1 hypothetical protein [Ancylobacter defluvii]
MIAALIALAFTLTGPVTAAQAMAGRMMASAVATDGTTTSADMASATMPCHEGVAAEAVAASMQGHDSRAYDTGVHGAAIRGGAPHGSGAPLSHLCCVLTCLMVPPLTVSHFALPLATATVLAAPPAKPLAGTSLARPDPPPRGA